MDFKHLANMKFGILTEANGPSPDPEKLVNSFMKEQVEAGNMVEETDDAQQEQNQPADQQEPAQSEQPQEDPNQQQNQNLPPEGQDDNPYALDNRDPNAMQQGQDMGDGQDIPDVPDDYNTDDDSPKLKILQSLSDKEYKLNNIHCHEQFKELYNNVENSINNYIMNIVTKDAKQQQIVTYIHNNLSRMLDDLNVYIVYKFSDIYEDNILAYTTFLKRYQIAMKIIKLINDKNHEE